MFGVKESEGAKWFPSGQKEFKEGLKEQSWFKPSGWTNSFINEGLSAG